MALSRKRISTDAIIRRIRALEARMMVAESPAVTFVTFHADGTITVNAQCVNAKGALMKVDTQVFDSGPAAMEYLDGITHRNPVIIDTMKLLPDTFYVDDTLFFYMSGSELAQLYQALDSDGAYMALYLAMARKYAFTGKSFKKGILGDLEAQQDNLSPVDLAKRYSDQKWFRKAESDDQAVEQGA